MTSSTVKSTAMALQRDGRGFMIFNKRLLIIDNTCLFASYLLSFINNF